MQTNEKGIEIRNHDGVLCIDSRLVAQKLGIMHKNLLETIRKYSQSVSRFGLVAFQTEADSLGRTNTPVKFAWLTEGQAIFIMTLSKNTPQVVEMKSELVAAFQEARQTLRGEQEKLTRMEVLLEIVQRMVEDERRIGVLEHQVKEVKEVVYGLEVEMGIVGNQVAQITHSHRKAERLLKEVERSAMTAEPKTTRAKINELVRQYSIAKDTDYRIVWNHLYKELKYRYHFDAKTRAKNDKKPILDVIEECGFEEQLYAIASELPNIDFGALGL